MTTEEFPKLFFTRKGREDTIAKITGGRQLTTEELITEISELRNIVMDVDLEHALDDLIDRIERDASEASDNYVTHI